MEAGKVTFAVTNMGTLYHEFIVYSNVDDVAPAICRSTRKRTKRTSWKRNRRGSALRDAADRSPDKKPGDADHRIRSEGWGAELTVDLKAGKYILLCNLAGHYAKAKQYAAFTAE